MRNPILGVALVALCALATACDKSSPPTAQQSPPAAVDLKAATLVDHDPRGWLDQLELRGDRVVAGGWAMNSNTAGAVDTVAIATSNKVVLAQVRPTVARPDVAQALKKPELANAGFAADFDAKPLAAAGTTDVSAYAYSAKDHTASRLGKTWHVTVQEGKITAITLNAGN